MQFGVSEAVNHWGRYRKNDIAVHTDGVAITYGDLASRVDLACTGIAACDVGAPGCRIAVALLNRLDLLVAILATVRLRFSIVPLHLGSSERGIQENLADTGAVAMIYDADHEIYLRLIDPTTPIVPIDVNLLSNNKSEKNEPGGECESSDEWGVLFTSGSTGLSKGIQRDQYSMVTEFVGWCLELGLTRHSRFYIGRPLYYTGGLVLAMSTLLVGGTLILNNISDFNDPVAVWSDYQNASTKLNIDWAFFVPDQLRRFVKLSDICAPKKLGAKSILVMGAPITGSEKVQVSQSLSCSIVESWGNSESLGTITDPEDIHVRPDSIGRPFLTDDLLVVDETFRAISPGQIGRIAGGEEAGFSEYSNRPEATARVKINQLIVSDDFGYRDHEGYFYISGREQEIVIVDGRTVFLPKIERAIRLVDNVLECFVSAYQHRSLKIGVMFVSTGETSKILLAIRECLSREAANDQYIGCILAVDSLPRLPSGKVDRVVCRRYIEERSQGGA
jgi:long-chain acyl-CoA synthetase